MVGTKFVTFSSEQSIAFTFIVIPYDYRRKDILVVTELTVKVEDFCIYTGHYDTNVSLTNNLDSNQTDKVTENILY